MIRRIELILLAMVVAADLFGAGGSARSIEPEKLKYIREKYYEGVENEDAIEELENYIRSEFNREGKDSPPLILAYEGGVEALKSKHAFWPVTKLDYFKKSMRLLARAVKEDPDNFEIRFVRYSILHHAPGFLGYSEEKKSDAGNLYEQLIHNKNDDFEYDVRRGIAEMLLDSGFLNEGEINLLKKYYPDAETK